MGQVSLLALVAYLASAASTVSLQETILEASTCPKDEVFTAYMSKWLSISGAVEPSDLLPAKQSFWDAPDIAQVRQLVEESVKSDPYQRAQFLAASAPHSGDWLLALPIASCGLRLDDEAIHVVVALRLGLNLGAPHTCCCGVLVDAYGQHGLVCKQAQSRIARQQQLNDMVIRALVSAGIPATKEPVSILRRDGKRPDGMMQIPWRSESCWFGTSQL